jgi:UDP-N-acetylmuramate dehydrogenase
MKIQERVPLKNFTTMRVGGNARFFCRIKTENDLEEAFKFVKKEKLNFFILGGGSNVIFSDDIFDGIVIKMEIYGVKYSVKNETALVSAGAGVLWDEFVEETVNQGLYGLENLSFIPGTVGASPVQNIGAYGVEAKDTIDSVVVFNIDTKKFETFPKPNLFFFLLHWENTEPQHHKKS